MQASSPQVLGKAWRFPKSTLFRDLQNEEALWGHGETALLSEQRESPRRPLSSRPTRVDLRALQLQVRTRQEGKRQRGGRLGKDAPGQRGSKGNGQVRAGLQGTCLGDAASTLPPAPWGIWVTSFSLGLTPMCSCTEQTEDTDASGFYDYSTLSRPSMKLRMTSAPSRARRGRSEATC